MMDKKFNQADKSLAKLTKNTEKELLQAYSKALKEIRKALALAYEKHGTKGKLEYFEMAKYNRLANLEKQISEEIRKLTGKNAMTLKKGIAEGFEESFYRTAFALETTVEAKLGFGLLDPKVIEAAVNNPLDRIGWKDRHKDNQAQLVKQLKQEIAQGLIQGKSYQEMAKSVKSRMEIGASKTQRIIQTETHRVQQDGRLQSLQQAYKKGVDMVKVWTSSLDGDTRDSHQDLDGVKVAMDEDFEGEFGSGPAPGQLGDPREDINCRCSVRAEIKGYSPEVRKARNSKTGRNEIIGYKTYNEWKADRIK